MWRSFSMKVRFPRGSAIFGNSMSLQDSIFIDGVGRGTEQDSTAFPAARAHLNHLAHTIGDPRYLFVLHLREARQGQDFSAARFRHREHAIGGCSAAVAFLAMVRDRVMDVAGDPMPRQGHPDAIA